MVDAGAYVEGAGFDRRQMLKRAAIGGGLVAAALATPGLTGTAEASGGKPFNLYIALDGASFQLAVPPAPGDPDTGPFYIGGEIFTPGPGTSIGNFHCWGYFVAPTGEVGVVNQEFNLPGRGKIQIAGVESNDPRAVTGGTGDFALARGEGIPDVTGFNLPEFFFTIDFSLTGAKGPPII